MCPFCFIPIVKIDEKGCDHMNCSNCLKDFNMCCMTKREITMQHDSAFFHRPSCKLYKKAPENYKLELKYWDCKEC
jgi:hypothetical protein